MASLTYNLGKQAGQIQVLCPDGARRSLYVHASEEKAEQITRHVSRLAKARVGRLVLDDDDETLKWLETKAGKALRPKLVKLGLVDDARPAGKPGVMTLTRWLTEYFATRVDVKPQTLITYRQVEENLTEYFGKTRPIKAITEFDADSWARWMEGKKKLAKATARRRCGHARMIFRAARKARHVPVNAFEDLACTVPGNKARARFIDRETIAKILEHCPDDEWRLIVLMSRYGGIRIPSELLRLTWDDLDWEHNRFTVHSPKTEHLEDHDTRFVPLFPELQGPLLALREKACLKEPRIITRYALTSSNLRTHFCRIIKRAGLTPWPRVFQNLRSSRQTELVQRWPLHLVCEWLGNTKLIAQRNYLQTRDEDFKLAAAGGQYAEIMHIASNAVSPCGKKT